MQEGCFFLFCKITDVDGSWLIEAGCMISLGGNEVKLVGTRTEQALREQLILSNKTLFEDTDKAAFLTYIREKFPGLETAYILHWIPEQEEDFYKILINDSIVVDIEMPRLAQKNPIIKSILLVPQYRLRLSKVNQIKLAVAMNLAGSTLIQDRGFS